MYGMWYNDASSALMKPLGNFLVMWSFHSFSLDHHHTSIILQVGCARTLVTIPHTLHKDNSNKPGNPFWYSLELCFKVSGFRDGGWLLNLGDWKLSSGPQQGKSEGFDSCDRPNNLTQIELKSSIFQHVWPWNLMDDLAKQKGSFSIVHQALCIISNPLVKSNWSYSPETLNSGHNRLFFVPCDLEIWRMTLKNNRIPFLNNINLCASFHHHMQIQPGVTVRKRLNWGLTSVTLTFDLWPWSFAWTSLLSMVIITPKNFMVIRWWKHSEKGITDRQTDWLNRS